MTMQAITPLLSVALASLLAAACSQPSADPGAAAVVLIGTVQGDGERSPLEGEEVTVEGVVTGNFGKHLGGWFLQDAGDGDPATSDALFALSDGDSPVRRGDRLRVRGRVLEHGEGDATLTALQPVEQETLEADARVEPLVLHGPPEDWERLEGMHIWIQAPLAISGHRDLAREGVLVASFDGRLPAPTEVALPGEDARLVAADNARRSVLIDDAMQDRDPRQIWYLPEDNQTPRTGSVLTGVQAVVDQRDGQYRLQLLDKPVLHPAPRPQPPEVEGDLRLAVFNLENLFNGDGRGGDFPTARGARSADEYARQLARLQASLQMLAPDIVALMELENDGYGPDSSIAQLATALGPDWRFVDAGEGPGEDAIRVGLLYRASVVEPVGAPATLEGGPYGTRSRVPLAQAFRADGGPVFTVVANHFKSKGCGEAVGLNRDQDDGQGCWNALRTDSARRLVEWLATDPTGSGTGLAALVGDLNSYGMEDPIRLLRDSGWLDVFEGRESYSYVFAAQAGRLTHALLSPEFADRLRATATWHSNSDEPANVGYRAANGDQPLESPWRSSDHDPVIIGVDARLP
ncbi:ExeM/NucH family extracellular endonuclease [Luteimonas sp. A478]